MSHQPAVLQKHFQDNTVVSCFLGKAPEQLIASRHKIFVLLVSNHDHFLITENKQLDQLNFFPLSMLLTVIICGLDGSILYIVLNTTRFTS